QEGQGDEQEKTEEEHDKARNGGDGSGDADSKPYSSADLKSMSVPVVQQQGSGANMKG
ncbi:unnamed protein product, partial [Amoebophrya sp. A25]